MDHTLLVLGLLKLQAMHGYQLSDLIDKRLGYLTDLKKPTLYHLLGKLEEAGDVARRVSRSGNRPERHTYRLTPAGETRFRQLLEANLRDAHHAYFNDDIGLLFLSEVRPTNARAYLQAKRASVVERLTRLDYALAQHQTDTPAYYTLRHHLLHLETELNWLDELQARLKRRAVRGDILACLARAETGAGVHARKSKP